MLKGTTFALITIVEGSDEYKEYVEAEILSHTEADARVTAAYGIHGDRKPIVRRLDKDRKLLPEQPEQKTEKGEVA